MPPSNPYQIAPVEKGPANKRVGRADEFGDNDLLVAIFECRGESYCR